ncbi:MAG TPA: peptidoglycan DD-metalloendopeptidase family protein [Pyrinomonadaceae bacterium]|jgi:murein DD-endopeptidase MepM/ murein hydrolase activator NlpD
MKNKKLEIALKAMLVVLMTINFPISSRAEQFSLKEFELAKANISQNKPEAFCIGSFPAKFGISAPVTFTQTGTGFFYPLGVTSWTKTGGTWLGRDRWYDTDGAPAYFDGYYHLGVDMPANVGDSVFTITNGRVVAINTSSDWGAGNVAVLVQHTLSNGQQFLAVYAHVVIDANVIKAGVWLSGGVRFAKVGSYPPGGNHLHFAIITNINQRGSLGRALNYDWPKQYNHVDPVGFIRANSPKCGDGSSVLYRPNGQMPNHPDGTLFKTATSGTVYIKYYGTKRAITSASRLYELYGPGRGFDFRDVIIIADDQFNSLARGADVTGPLPNNGYYFEPNGRLIRQRGGSEISIVSNGQRRPFASGEAFLRLGYSLCNVAQVDNYASYPVGPPIN